MIGWWFFFCDKSVYWADKNSKSNNLHTYLYFTSQPTSKWYLTIWKCQKTKIQQHYIINGVKKAWRETNSYIIAISGVKKAWRETPNSYIIAIFLQAKFIKVSKSDPWCTDDFVRPMCANSAVLNIKIHINFFKSLYYHNSTNKNSKSENKI